MIYRIETESDFIKALKESKSSDTIWQVSPHFDAKEIGLTHSSGAKLIDINFTMHQRKYGGVEGIVPYLTVTKSTELVRVTPNGIMPENPTNYKDDGLQLGIVFSIPYAMNCFECNSYSMNYSGFMIELGSAYFIGGEFKDSATPKQDYGFGHPIIQSSVSGLLSVRCAKFSNNRHHIMSSYESNSVSVRSCEFFFSEYSKHGLDRHSRNGYGGSTYHVENCIFHNPNNYAYDLAKHSGGVTFKNCKFARPFGKNGRVGVEVNGRVEMQTEREGIANYIDNIYEI